MRICLVRPFCVLRPNIVEMALNNLKTPPTWTEADHFWLKSRFLSRPWVLAIYNPTSNKINVREICKIFYAGRESITMFYPIAPLYPSSETNGIDLNTPHFAFKF